jgi:hypothetical protein
MISDNGAFASLALPLPTSGGALDPLGVAFLEIDLAGILPLQAEILEIHLVADLHRGGIVARVEEWQQAAAIGVQQIQVPVHIRHDLAQERIQVHIALQLLPEGTAAGVVFHGLVAVHSGL